MQIWGVKWRFVNVYAPTLPSGRRELFGGLDVILSTIRWLVFGGDFYVSVEGGDFSARALRDLIKRFGLVDAFRALNPADPGYTWGNSRGARSRLDFIFVSEGLRVGAAAVKPMYFSDHSEDQTWGRGAVDGLQPAAGKRQATMGGGPKLTTDSGKP